MLENVKNAESLCTLENSAIQKVSIIIYPFSLNHITELETKTSGIFGSSLVHPDLICVCAACAYLRFVSDPFSSLWAVRGAVRFKGVNFVIGFN